jgi:sulfur relay (sulfurtransferase) complex TusBCD TusD component (DsrE family)
MKDNSVILFTRFGLGSGPEPLQHTLVDKFLSLTLETSVLPSKILFYTDGVKLTCDGSPVLEILGKYADQGVELVICKTCLNYFQLVDRVKVGIVGGMGDIIEALQKADKVISL